MSGHFLTKPSFVKDRGEGPSDREGRMRLFFESFSRSSLIWKDFCRQRGVSIGQFQYWRKRLGYNFREHRRQISKGIAVFPQGPSFVRLSVEPQPHFPQESASSSSGGFVFELSLPGGIVFRGTEALALKSLDRILRRGR